MIALIGGIISLALLIFKEYFSQKAASDAANKQFALDQATFNGIASAALQKQVASMAQASQGAASGWDAADQDANKKGGP